MLIKPEIKLKTVTAHRDECFIHRFCLDLHAQISCLYFCMCADNYETLTSHRPPIQKQLHEFLHSSSVKCPAKTKAVQQRTKQRGISVPRLSAHAHPHRVTLNIIKHSPSVTHNTTKHSSGAMLLKQTLRRNPRG